MTHAVDIDAYFARVGYTGGREASLQNLREIVRRHTETIPFEDLNPLTGKAVDLDAVALQRKLIDDRRGGYCFEQNLLLSNVLQQLGYHVTGLAARVMWNLPDAMVLPRTHMLLLVELAGEPCIVDVGFGGLTLTGVLRLQAGLEQTTPHEPFRFIRPATSFIMQAWVHSEWCSLYSFDLQEQTQADYEVANWYTSAHPTSRFVNNLIAARTLPDRRYALFNTEFAVHHLNGVTQRRILSSAAELRESLERDFLLQVPDTPDVNEALQRVAGSR